MVPEILLSLLAGSSVGEGSSSEEQVSLASPTWHVQDKFRRLLLADRKRSL